MSTDNSALRIPIEIKTDDLKEIRQLVQEITEAESSVRELKPLKGKSKGSSSRSAFPSASTDAFGIFSMREGEAVPSKTRDKTSKQAFQRESEFEKLKEEITNQRKETEALRGGLNSILNGVFGISIAGQGATTATKIKSGISAGAGIGNSILSGGNLISNLAAKLVWPIAGALIAIGFVETLVDKLTSPGGIWDRRFRRNFSRESTRLSSLQEKAEITAGRRIIRVTTIGGLRGESSQVRSNLDYVKTGIRIYDLNGVLSKNVGVGTI